MTRFDPSELARFGGLALVARQVVEGFLTGIHRSPYKGYSQEFAEHRQYSPGDEIRRIDWRAFGKMDKYFVKEYEDETNLRAMIVVDASGSMAYRGGQSLSKWEYARQLAASLSYLLLSQRDAVGLILHDHKSRSVVPPKSASKQLLEILRSLQSANTGGETSLGPIWERAVLKYVKRRSLVVLISDCFDQIDSLRRALRHLRFSRHEVLLFQILAPEEIDFPFDQPTRFQSLEQQRQVTELDTRRMRDEYKRNFELHQQQLRELATASGVEYLMMRTNEPLDRALGSFISRR